MMIGIKFFFHECKKMWIDKFNEISKNRIQKMKMNTLSRCTQNKNPISLVLPSFLTSYFAPLTINIVLM